MSCFFERERERERCILNSLGIYTFKQSEPVLQRIITTLIQIPMPIFKLEGKFQSSDSNPNCFDFLNVRDPDTSEPNLEPEPYRTCK
jgi:hypothetical protein